MKKTIPFDILSLIYKKRTAAALSATEIEGFVQSICSTAPPPDYQIASLLAFIYAAGMSTAEIAALTRAMRVSGKQFDYTSFPKGSFFVDKHSTGGVGDKVTLALAPLVVAASERIHFPTIAGRGLGHTGGTVDKLESIPGFECGQTLSSFYKILKKHRLCFLQQTKEIAPADRLLYVLRDVTGTVESIPLITASILSKKLSESLDFLLLDIKFGNGAFLPELADSEKLAESLLQVTRAADVKTSIYLTRMDTPLGHYSGNRMEILETITILKNEGPGTSSELTKLFGRRILEASGISTLDAEKNIEIALSSGAAYEKFAQIVAAQGGSLEKFLAQKLRLKRI